MLGAPPRNMTKWLDWEEARKLENGEWRPEPEEEAEVPEIIIVSDAVEGTPVDLDGESRHEQVEAKLSRREREMLNEGEEIRSPKRKVIRVESEETQDYVREEKITEFEEEKQRTFIPSAVDVPLKPLFRCDKQCREKTLSYWQLASVVVNEGDEAQNDQPVSDVFQQTLAGKSGGRKAVVKPYRAVETGGGKESVSTTWRIQGGSRNRQPENTWSK